jgi:predicted ATPase/transcriptional regulator with XRE-family HTH domain
MDAERSFGDWLRQRRKALDLTQDELARQVGCSAITLRKLEAEERRPSKQIAERLAEVLQVAVEERPAFLRFARGDPFAAPSTTIAEAVKYRGETSVRSHNLPIQLTSFVGREKEMAEVRQLLGGRDDPVGRLPAGGDVPPERLYHRLVTLTGAGGCGKTRLALQVASQIVAEYPDGVWLVELAPLADPTLVPQTVATALGLKQEPGRPLLATLTDNLRGKQVLLILDNCEHLIATSAQLAEAVLRACPKLRLLATSREPLGIAGEVPFLVPSLSSPDPLHPIPVDTLTQYEAVQLFVDRAVTALPGFAVTNANAPSVVQVCHQLDGIPLAIELAAARVKLLQVEQIAERLDDRFQLLTGGSRTALPRHQTLAALIDWSYDLLSKPERVLLGRLSVFAGGWTLEAAEAVCANTVGADLGVGPGAGAGEHTAGEHAGSPLPLDETVVADIRISPDDILDLLTQLVNKSLVLAERRQGEEARYRMLETIRQYALEKLTTSGEADAVRRRHAAYYLALAEAVVPSNPVPFARYDRMQPERDNLRAALTWSHSATGSAELGLRLAWAMWEALEGEHWSERRGWMEGALAHAEAEGPDSPQVRARVLFELGFGLGMASDYVAAQARLADSLKLFQELGDLKSSAEALNRLGWLAREHGDATTARLRLEESLALCQELGDKAGIASALLTLGEVAVMQEDPARATALVEESLALLRHLGDTHGIAWAFNHLGHVAQLQGKYEQATRLHEESLTLLRKIDPEYIGVPEANHSLGETALAWGDAALAATHFRESVKLSRHLGVPKFQAWCLAGVAALDEEPERAAWLWDAAEALRQSIGVREAPASRATRERLIAQACEQLGEAAFAAAWAEGQAALPEQAMAQALRSSA